MTTGVLLNQGVHLSRDKEHNNWLQLSLRLFISHVLSAEIGFLFLVKSAEIV